MCVGVCERERERERNPHFLKICINIFSARRTKYWSYLPTNSKVIDESVREERKEKGKELILYLRYN
jgi:hypothetical protein